jgi:hypothetical protein
MAGTFAAFWQRPMARPALIVPTVIMLIFSLFNLTAPPDPARSAAAFRLGIVNLDEGLTFPPIRVADKLLENLPNTLPFQIMSFDAEEAARAALEQGQVAAVVILPAEFSKLAFGDQSFEIAVWNAQHLTVAETQMAGQLPIMLQMAMSAGVASLRLALAKGRLPDGKLPVTTVVTTLHEVDNTAKLPAPFVLLFTTWLAAMVGALLLALSTRGLGRTGAAAIRTAVPVVSFGLGALVLATVVAAATSDWGLLGPVFLAVWPTALALGWLMTGILTLVGPVAVVVLLPVVFYQSALGGVMAPVAAAPAWLAGLGADVPFDALGGYYRGVVHGTGAAMPVAWLGAAAALGLTLIWLSAVLRKA